MPSTKAKARQKKKAKNKAKAAQAANVNNASLKPSGSAEESVTEAAAAADSSPADESAAGAAEGEYKLRYIGLPADKALYSMLGEIRKLHERGKLSDWEHLLLEIKKQQELLKLHLIQQQLQHTLSFGIIGQPAPTKPATELHNEHLDQRKTISDYLLTYKVMQCYVETNIGYSYYSIIDSEPNVQHKNLAIKYANEHLSAATRLLDEYKSSPESSPEHKSIQVRLMSPENEKLLEQAAAKISKDKKLQTEAPSPHYTAAVKELSKLCKEDLVERIESCCERIWENYKKITNEDHQTPQKQEANRFVEAAQAVAEALQSKDPNITLANDYIECNKAAALIFANFNKPSEVCLSTVEKSHKTIFNIATKLQEEGVNKDGYQFPLLFSTLTAGLDYLSAIYNNKFKTSETSSEKKKYLLLEKKCREKLKELIGGKDQKTTKDSWYYTTTTEYRKNVETATDGLKQKSAKVFKNRLVELRKSNDYKLDHLEEEHKKIRDAEEAIRRKIVEHKRREQKKAALEARKNSPELNKAAQEMAAALLKEYEEQKAARNKFIQEIAEKVNKAQEEASKKRAKQEAEERKKQAKEAAELAKKEAAEKEEREQRIAKLREELKAAEKAYEEQKCEKDRANAERALKEAKELEEQARAAAELAEKEAAAKAAEAKRKIQEAKEKKEQLLNLQGPELLVKTIAYLSEKFQPLISNESVTQIDFKGSALYMHFMDEKCKKRAQPADIDLEVMCSFGEKGYINDIEELKQHIGGLLGLTEEQLADENLIKFKEPGRGCKKDKEKYEKDSLYRDAYNSLAIKNIECEIPLAPEAGLGTPTMINIVFRHNECLLDPQLRDNKEKKEWLRPIDALRVVYRENGEAKDKPELKFCPGCKMDLGHAYDLFQARNYNEGLNPNLRYTDKLTDRLQKISDRFDIPNPPGLHEAVEAEPKHASNVPKRGKIKALVDAGPAPSFPPLSLPSPPLSPNAPSFARM